MWNWEEVDVGRAGAAGDLSKLFRNEGTKAPGVLAVNRPSIDGTILAREAIQNSWDAARALQNRREDAPDFELEFSFQAIEGQEKESLVEALGLRSLRERAEAQDRRKLGLNDEDALTHLDDLSKPLRLLVLRETGTTGMEGPWGSDSKMYLALVSIGFTLKESGAGGSYGYGKAGLIRASSIRTVVGYSSFEAHESDPATRRLLGMTYWAPHRVDNVQFTGFGRWSEPSEDLRPFEDAEADSRAEALGLELRGAGVVKNLGTTFLLVDPTVEPADLNRSIARNWWPALEDQAFNVTVEDYDGSLLHPRPRKDEVLRAFIRGYELATTPQDNGAPEEYAADLQMNTQGDGRIPTGRIGLVADLQGWSYPRAAQEEEDEGVSSHKSLVALVRGPRMVVEYRSLATPPPYVRGTFVADEGVDELLRQTEPKAHDAWLDKIEEEGLDPEAPRVAKSVKSAITRNVNLFRGKLRPPAPREQDIRLPVLDQLFKSILDNRGPRKPSPPRPDPRVVSIAVDQRLEPADEVQIRVRASSRVSLNDRFPEGRAPASVWIRYAFDEDGRVGENCPITIKPPAGFQPIETTHRGVHFSGELTREAVTFEITSDPYPADWTGRLWVTAEPVMPKFSDPEEAIVE